jgi:hypothetical protein
MPGLALFAEPVAEPSQSHCNDDSSEDAPTADEPAARFRQTKGGVWPRFFFAPNWIHRR